MGSDLIKKTDGLTNSERLSNIFNLEDALMELDQIDMPVENVFCGGIYARKLFIPKDTILTGKMHTEDNLNIMLYGDIEVATEDGLKRFNKPCLIVSKAGVKRAGYTHEDTMWITLHATNKTDVEEIEKEFIMSDSEAKSFLDEKKRLEG